MSAFSIMSSTYQGSSSNMHETVISYKCSLCENPYKNRQKCEIHEKKCQHKQSQDPEKLCWNCNNPVKNQYSSYIWSAHGTYPASDNESDHSHLTEEEFYDLVEEADREEYIATHCWYCSRFIPDETDMNCHVSYCKTREH